jgi:conjugal transfer pilus assembly protein TraB
MATPNGGATATKPKSFKEQWEALPAGKRRNIAMLGGVGVVLAIAFVVVSGGGTSGGARNAKGRIENALMVADGSRDLGAAGVANDMKEVNRRLREMEGENARMRAMIDRRQNGEEGAASTEARLQSELSELRRQVSEMQQRGTAGPGANGRPVVTPGTPLRPGQPQTPMAPGQANVPGPGPGPVGTATGPDAQPMPIAPPAYGGIRTIKPEEPPQVAVETAEAKREEPQIYLPTGSMISGVLLAGVDAPTGKSAMKDPIPVLARIKHDAILPNRYRADVKECFALMEATGDLASERAMMRLTNISCVRRDRAVIDLPIAGYAVGEDGRAGMRGRLVSKQGQVLAKAMMAGFAEGISSAFGGQNQNMFNPMGGDVNYGSVPEAGAIGGASSALDRVAAYYLNLADQLHPTVEIDSGRPVTIVLLKGRQLASLAAGNEQSQKPGNGAR